MKTWTKDEIQGAINWLGHPHENFHLAMLREVLDGFNMDCLDGDIEAQAVVEAFKERIVDALVPDAVAEALITVWSQDFAGRVAYELAEAVKRLPVTEKSAGNNASR